MLGENTPPDLDIDLLDSVLLEAIASTYKRCSAKTSNPIPLFGDLAAELAHWQDRDRNQKINAMAQMASTKLRAWVDEGPYARLFDRPTTVQLNNPWLYFNVEKLKDDPRLERAMSLLIAHTATYRASGITGQPSIVLLDECWALLESPILASVVVQLFRTARKRNASVWGISQTPEDFVGTPDKPNEHGAGIVKNATTKIIGKQPGDMTALREHVHLNETALNQIKTFAHPKKGHSAEFLIAIGEKAESTHAIRIVPSPVDYWITTTYARERAFRKWWLHQHQQLPLIQAYEELAAQYPRGLAELAPLPVGTFRRDAGGNEPMTDNTQPEIELLLNGEPYTGDPEMRPKAGRQRSLEEEIAHWCSHDRDVRCPAEAGSWAIPQRLQLDLQLNSERHRQLAQVDQPDCPADAEALSDDSGAAGGHQPGPRLRRELNQHLSRPDEPGLQHAVHQRGNSRTATVRKHPA